MALQERGERLTTDQSNEYCHTAANNHQNPTSTFPARILRLRGGSEKCQNLQ